MSKGYTISPIKDSLKVTYEVQYNELGKWEKYGISYPSAESAFSKLKKARIHNTVEFRVIQRTESVAIVVRDIA